MVLIMRNTSLDRIIWILIYSGLLLFIVGLFLLQGQPGLGWILLVLGAAEAATGGVLIWVRSRRPD